MVKNKFLKKKMVLAFSYTSSLNDFFLRSSFLYKNINIIKMKGKTKKLLRSPHVYSKFREKFIKKKSTFFLTFNFFFSKFFFKAISPYLLGFGGGISKYSAIINLSDEANYLTT